VHITSPLTITSHPGTPLGRCPAVTVTVNICLPLVTVGLRSGVLPAPGW
jgi:hypothetical protein